MLAFFRGSMGGCITYNRVAMMNLASLAPMRAENAFWYIITMKIFARLSKNYEHGKRKKWKKKSTAKRARIKSLFSIVSNVLNWPNWLSSVYSGRAPLWYACEWLVILCDNSCATKANTYAKLRRVRWGKIIKSTTSVLIGSLRAIWWLSSTCFDVSKAHTYRQR